VSKRKQKRARLAARLVALMSLALTAALLWRWVSTVPAPSDSLRTALPMPAQTLTAPGTQPQPEHEELNTVERQSLENILRQKNAAARR
jgi:hypothetical protein